MITKTSQNNLFNQMILLLNLISTAAALLFGIGLIYTILDETIGRIRIIQSKFEWNGLQIKDFIFLIISSIILLGNFTFIHPFWNKNLWRNIICGITNLTSKGILCKLHGIPFFISYSFGRCIHSGSIALQELRSYLTPNPYNPLCLHSCSHLSTPRHK